MQVAYNHIRKGLQKDVLYKGLKAKYIYYCLFLGFGAILMGLVLSTFIPMVLVLIILALSILSIFLVLLGYSSTYGAHGFIKKIADRNGPSSIKIATPFKNLPLWKSN